MNEKPKIPALTPKKIEEINFSRECADNSAKKQAKARNESRSLIKKMLHRKEINYKDVAHENAIKENALYENKDIPKPLTFPWRGSDNPTEKDMQIFFTPEIISQRVLFCPEINVDMTDDWGMFGYEKGFIFLESLEKEGVNCFNDENWETGESLKLIGASVPVLPHYDFFPRQKFSHVLITPSRCPAIYNFLRNKIENVKLLEKSNGEEKN